MATSQDLWDLLLRLSATERELSSQGRKEYAQGDDVLDNFKRNAVSLGVTPEVILGIYAAKHFDGILSYIRGHVSQREDVRGRINDLRLYLALLHLMVDEKEDKDILAPPEMMIIGREQD